MHAVGHIVEHINGGNGDHVGLVVGEVVVREQQFLHRGEVGTIFQFDIDHAAMDTRAERDGHRKRVLHARDGLGGHRVSHAATGTEIGVGDALGGDGSQQGAHHGVGTGIPTRRDDAHRLVLLRDGHKLLAKVVDLSVDVEAIDGADAAFQQLFRKCGHLARGRAKRGHIGLDVVQIVVMVKNANQLHVPGSQNCLFDGLSDVAVSNNSDSCLHKLLCLKMQKYIFCGNDQRSQIMVVVTLSV